MKVRIAFLLCPVFAALHVSCSDADTRTALRGIGTVERTDSSLAVHYYDYTLLPVNTDLPGLDDSARVEFYCKGVKVSDTALVYEADFLELSGDLRTPILYNDSVTQASDSLTSLFFSEEKFNTFALHITRDWRRCDYLDVGALYVGSSQSNDLFALVRDPSDGAEVPDSLMVFWLRLRRQLPDSTQYVSRQISVPINSIADTTKERVQILVKYLNQLGDTASRPMTYSYVNFIDQSFESD